jgi:hypothetical protein
MPQNRNKPSLIPAVPGTAVRSVHLKLLRSVRLAQHTDIEVELAGLDAKAQAAVSSSASSRSTDLPPACQPTCVKRRC